jgi:small GTP-binding protein
MAIKKKIVMLGDSAVGKTSLIRRFVFDKFDDAYISTIGSKVTKKEMSISKDDKKTDLRLMIWDILGREGYTATHSRTFAGVHGAILVCDMTRRETLKTLERYWIPLLFDVVEHVPLVFACNKNDLSDDSAFEQDDLIAIASRYNSGFKRELPADLATCFSTSAKTGDNVESAFESLGHMVLTEEIPDDPIKDLYESLVAMGKHRQTDRGTPMGALDAIIVDFCDDFDDDRIAMSLLRQEIVRAGIDIRSPSKEGLLKLIEYLAEAQSEYKDEKFVISNRDKWFQLARDVKDYPISKY